MKNVDKNLNRETSRTFEWVIQILALVIVSPALIYSLMSLNSLPYG